MSCWEGLKWSSFDIVWLMLFFSPNSSTKRVRSRSPKVHYHPFVAEKQSFPSDLVCFCGKSSVLQIYQWCLIVYFHYNDVIMGAIASKITSLTIVYSTIYSGADQRKHQSSASLASVRGIHRRPVNSPHTWPVTQKMFDDRHRVHGNGLMSIATIKQNKAQTVCMILGMYFMHCIGNCYSKNVVGIWDTLHYTSERISWFGDFFTFVALNVSILITPSHQFISCNEFHFDGLVQDCSISSAL